jgi:hypothetical protein
MTSPLTFYVDGREPTALFSILTLPNEEEETAAEVLTEPYEFDEDTPINFNASASFDTVNGPGTEPGDIVLYKWDWDESDGLGSDEQGENVTYPGFTDPGTYVVTLNISDSAGHNATVNATITIRDISKPIVTIDGPAGGVVDVGEEFTLDASATYDDLKQNQRMDDYEDENLTFRWDTDPKTDSDGDGTDDNDADMTGPEITLSYDDTGQKKVLLNVTDRAGNFATKEFNIEVRGSFLIIEELKVSAKKIRTADILHTKEPEKLTVTVVINNTGTVDSGAFLVELYIDGDYKAKKLFDNLTAGRSVTWSKKVTFDKEGKHRIRVNITADDKASKVPGDEQDFIPGQHIDIEATQPEPDSIYIYGIGVAIIGVVAVIMWYFYYGPGSLRRMKSRKSEKKKGLDEDEEDEDED